MNKFEGLVLPQAKVLSHHMQHIIEYSPWDKFDDAGISSFLIDIPIECDERNVEWEHHLRILFLFRHTEGYGTCQ